MQPWFLPAWTAQITLTWQENVGRPVVRTIIAGLSIQWVWWQSLSHKSLVYNTYKKIFDLWWRNASLPHSLQHWKHMLCRKDLGHRGLLCLPSYPHQQIACKLIWNWESGEDMELEKVLKLALRSPHVHWHLHTSLHQQFAGTLKHILKK